MYELLIVDDEWYAARGVATGIDWRCMGFTSVHVAHHIERARQILTDRNIDVMICDIEMPMGDGFELLEWVNDRSLQVKTLLLTCHSEFEYAKRAVRLGSVDYLVKPVRYEELQRIMEKLVVKLSEEREQQSFMRMLKTNYDLWTKHRPLLVERFWMDVLVHNVGLSGAQIREMIKENHLSYPPTARFVPVLLSILRWRAEFSLREQQALEYGVRSAWEKSMFTDGLQGQAIQPASSKFMAILDVDMAAEYDQSLLMKRCLSFIAVCNDQFYCDVTIYVGQAVGVDSIRKAAELLFDADSGNVTVVNQVQAVTLHQLARETPYRPNIATWMDMLKRGEREKLLKDIGRIVEAMQEEGVGSAALFELYQDVLQMLYHVLQLKELQAKRVFAHLLTAEQAAAATRSIGGFKNWATQIVSAAIEAVQSVEESHTVLEQAKRYIEDYLHTGITRETVAEHVFLHPDYLTRLFKKETGLSIAEYIHVQRIQYAKQQLMESSSTISSIAAAIGYKNFSHFSMIFKRDTGLSPVEFRKRHLHVEKSKKR